MRDVAAKAVSPVSYPPVGDGLYEKGHQCLMPIVDYSKCAKCNLCWIYCPESVIEKNSIKINYKYCKGCGICANECHKNAITMEREEQL